ncbi:prephenate/arogenate dehydrogenase family protein [Altererythrobacter sp.]|uniref:prephenate/arogenate dehydrogenase family protein n=1 Tax=Altererythrobacter sp. TaxID=1872480 RepID=UPI001B19C99D|nr:prephenate/arogenate dehydrogenase family protein [Altererythrobacter sp.]MBO6609332.1 prephenate/arogenate dehydrogenase family protein [Altererythrobacter sp.]MBO6640667.1 prephenate/arogenate dehydrogenase family protein [Altererythrobacter sp.]MBO6708635.1 prephenate/arogenate dehydrogenase family protein [Altererythrobacter sp.]
MSIQSVAIIGLGLLGGSIGLAVKARAPNIMTTGYDADADVRTKATERGLVRTVFDSAADAVAEADLVILCVPVGAMKSAATEIAGHLKLGAIISDVGSSKQSVIDDLTAALPGATLIPAHPVAGTEQSGPEAGFATLFENRWCILTPPQGADEAAVESLAEFWGQLGSKIEIMDAEHHDLVLAVTSHIPHLIAYTIVGTASDLEDVTRSEVIKYSAGGFRDFTRIAASNPTMWRDVFLHNKSAVLEMLGRFTEDLTALQRAIRSGDGDTLHELFSRTRAIRRGIIEEGQDDAAPDFGREH